MQNETYIIQAQGIGRTHVDDTVRTRALSAIHLNIRPGVYLAITGPSGSGKSTLLMILGLMDTHSAGRLCFLGEDVTHISLARAAEIRNREIGFVFQSYNLIGDLNVEENLMLPLRFQGLRGPQRRTLADEMLERLGLTEIRRMYPVVGPAGGALGYRIPALPPGNGQSARGPGIVSQSPLDGIHARGLTRYRAPARIVSGLAIEQGSDNYIPFMGIEHIEGQTTPNKTGLGLLANRVFAERYWPNESLLGKRVMVRDEINTIIGVVGNVAGSTIRSPTEPQLYEFWSRSPPPGAFA